MIRSEVGEPGRTAAATYDTGSFKASVSISGAARKSMQLPSASGEDRSRNRLADGGEAVAQICFRHQADNREVVAQGSRNPRGAAPVCAASTSMVIVPAPIKVKISS